jgi:hypothetical protein
MVLSSGRWIAMKPTVNPCWLSTPMSPRTGVHSVRERALSALARSAVATPSPANRPGGSNHDV